MKVKFAATLVGMALVFGGAPPAGAGDPFVVLEETPPYLVVPAWPSVRTPFILGRYAPYIGMPPHRYYAYPYVSSYDRCVRWRSGYTRRGWRAQRIWVCG